MGREKHPEECEISDIARDVVEAFALLGCYAEYICSCLSTFRRSLSVPSLTVKLFNKVETTESRNVGKNADTFSVISLASNSLNLQNSPMSE